MCADVYALAHFLSANIRGMMFQEGHPLELRQAGHCWLVGEAGRIEYVRHVCRTRKICVDGISGGSGELDLEISSRCLRFFSCCFVLLEFNRIAEILEFHVICCEASHSFLYDA